MKTVLKIPVNKGNTTDFTLRLSLKLLFLSWFIAKTVYVLLIGKYWYIYVYFFDSLCLVEVLKVFTPPHKNFQVVIPKIMTFLSMNVEINVSLCIWKILQILASIMDSRSIFILLIGTGWYLEVRNCFEIINLFYFRKNLVFTCMSTYIDILFQQ